jgi:hypothetical protein
MRSALSWLYWKVIRPAHYHWRGLAERRYR